MVDLIAERSQATSRASIAMAEAAEVLLIVVAYDMLTKLTVLGGLFKCSLQPGKREDDGAGEDPQGEAGSGD